MQRATILRSHDCEKIESDWGTLTWYASEKLGNSDAITVGKCVIKPGCRNPLHSHPNCSEVLVVTRGRIAHTVENGEEVTLDAGDVITLPEDMPHNARNIGDSDAILMIAFTSGDRQTKGE